MKRKSPIKHKVKTHTREGTQINSYSRGKGLRTLKLPKLNISKLSSKQKEKIRKLAENKIHEKLRKGEYPNVPAIYGEYVHIDKERIKGLSIDKNIFPLLVAMAKANFRLIGSCEGHTYQKNRWTNALVYFESDTKKINKLIEQITGLHNVDIIHRRGNKYSLEITVRGRENVDNVIKELIKVIIPIKETEGRTFYNKRQLKMGIKIELEHTTNKKVAEKIAKDHLDEFPDYYTRLKKMENLAKKEMKKYKITTKGKKRRIYKKGDYPHLNVQTASVFDSIKDGNLTKQQIFEDLSKWGAISLSSITQPIKWLLIHGFIKEVK